MVLRQFQSDSPAVTRSEFHSAARGYQLDFYFIYQLCHFKAHDYKNDATRRHRLPRNSSRIMVNIIALRRFVNLQGNVSSAASPVNSDRTFISRVAAYARFV